MRHLWFGLTAFTLLVGCAPIAEVSKIGNEYAQHSYSRNRSAA